MQQHVEFGANSTEVCIVSDLQIAGDVVKHIKGQIFEVGRHARSMVAVRDIRSMLRRVGNPKPGDKCDHRCDD